MNLLEDGQRIGRNRSRKSSFRRYNLVRIRRGHPWVHVSCLTLRLSAPTMARLVPRTRRARGGCRVRRLVRLHLGTPFFYADIENVTPSVYVFSRAASEPVSPSTRSRNPPPRSFC